MRALPLAAVVLGLAWLASRTHQVGHDWGDDFALYIRQALGIVEGNPAEITADNRFSLAASSWDTFSPDVYPWGWPLLMAPVVVFTDVDYGALKVLVMAFWCAALVFWHMIVRERAGQVTAWALMILLGVSWPFVVWTNSVVSDIPYLGCAFGVLWWCDRCRRRQAWATGPLTSLVALGLLLALCFNIRREGLALVAAVGALNLVQLLGDKRSRTLEPARWDRMLLVLGTFLAASAAFQILLPSVVSPSYPGTGLANIPLRLEWYRDIVAQQFGLMAASDDRPTLLGSTPLALGVMTAVLVLAAVGLVARLVLSPRTDLPLAVFAGAHAFVVGIAPFQEGRYLFPIVPVVLYFAAVAPASVVALARQSRTQPQTDRAPWWPVAAATALVAVLAVSSFVKTWDWGNRATALRDSGQVQWGPEHPDAVEMFSAVGAVTRPDDVVAFFRSRAMTMATERSALQSGDIETIVANADWYAMERGSTYSQPLVSEDEAILLGLERVWSNGSFVLYRVPPEAKERLAAS